MDLLEKGCSAQASIRLHRGQEHQWRSREDGSLIVSTLQIFQRLTPVVNASARFDK